MADFVMPSLGADMESGELVEWLVKPGDEVKRGDIVAVVETAKGAIDVEIYQAGKVLELVIEEGTKVPVGTVLATLDGEDGPPPEVASTAAPTSTTDGRPPPPRPSPAAAGRVRASPLARRRAGELQVDLAAVPPTGPDRTVTVADVEKASAAAGPRDMRAAIAATMSRANRDIPHYHLAHTIDVNRAMTWLRAENERRPVRERLLPVALLARATALALRKHPELNGHWVDGRFDPGEDVALGVAVSLRGGGLVAPAIRGAADLSLTALMEALRDVTGRARAGGLRSSEMHGATATLTNLGDMGVDVVHGIIHPPQVALIGFGAIAERPWVVDGAIVPRHLVQASLSADHRATDGHLGGKLLLAIDRFLQRPEDL